MELADAGNSAKPRVRFASVALVYRSFACAFAEILGGLQLGPGGISARAQGSLGGPSGARTCGGGRLAGSAALDLVARRSRGAGGCLSVSETANWCFPIGLALKSPCRSRASVIRTAIEKLAELSAFGIRIRTRALITTLAARLLLGDVVLSWHRRGEVR